MARSRSVPVAILDDPDYFERPSETQAVLLGLVLIADDEGRGLAHVGFLGRKFNKETALIETALTDLESCGLLEIYEVGRHRYFWLTRWSDWQTLSKPTPSKYPAPPAADAPETPSQNVPEFPQNPQGNSGEFWETPPEGEEKVKGREDEGEGEETPPNVVPFPASTSSTAASTSEENLSVITAQVARTLKVPASAALAQVVQEFAPNATLSLTGEAMEAREYIDDPRRNHKRHTMSPGFFRRWLKRCYQSPPADQRPAPPATQASPTMRASPGKSLPSLMNLREQYQAVPAPPRVKEG
ncbi:MAG: hypothetical protein H0W02_12545 [Ktedonobacteraceae bacterium]|nr:hypothetical protein [Ktedonobacteraceae bacterium]